MPKIKPVTGRKYSIKEVDSLIESIKLRKPELTEEAICVELGRNEGYISQLRSREKATQEPQVSPKFMTLLQQYNATLQNANSGIDINLAVIAQTLARLENGQHYIRAELRGYEQYQIQQQVGWDQDKFLAAMERVGMIIGANLQAGDLQDNNDGAGKKHKQSDS